MAENGKLPDSDLEVTYLYYPGTTNGRRLRDDVADYAEAMALAFYLEFGKPLYATDGYRDYATQVQLKKEKGPYAATPGTSNHGWGKALDLASGVQSFSSAEHKWLRANADRWGFVHPTWAHDGYSGNGMDEAWHWEYVGGGTSSPRILRPRTGRGEVGLGSEGERVERVQGLLNDRLSGPDIATDGKFGLGTAVAVAKFQKSRGLNVTGRVGTATLAALENRTVPSGAEEEEKAEMTTEEKIDKILWNVRETKTAVDELVAVLLKPVSDGTGSNTFPTLVGRDLDVDRRALALLGEIKTAVTALTPPPEV